MNKLKRTILLNAEILKSSEKKMRDIYEITMSNRDNVFIEEPTMTRKLTYTYSQINARIERAARAIAAVIPDGSCYIGLHGENSAEWIIAFWAILMSGNKPYLVNLRQPKGFTENILSTLDAKCVITINSNVEYSRKTLRFDDIANSEYDEAQAIPEFADEFAISTSGTTLKEKICIYHGTEISDQILNLETIIETNPKIIGTYNGVIKTLAFLPFYHIFGLEAVLLWYSFLGSTFVFIGELTPENILRTIRNHEVTHIFSVPMLWHAMEKALRKELAAASEKDQRKFRRASKICMAITNKMPRLGDKLTALLFKEIRYMLLGESIRFCISGGSYIKESAVELLNSIGYPLCNGYGMTEIGICSVELAKTPKERMLCSIGKPFDSLEYKVDSDGRLWVRGDSVCKNIIIDKQPQILDDWFDTGDIVSVGADGRYYIKGRYSDVVFSDNGENLNPDLAERAFFIRDALELSVLGNEDGSKLMLLIRIPNSLVSEQLARIREDVEMANDNLPASYRVHDVRFTTDPIIQPGGIKVSRAYVKRAIAEGKIRLFDPEREEPAEQSNSEIKQIVREAFAKVLDIDVNDIGDNMHFMNELGGTSLDYFALVNELDERFGLKIDFGSDYDLEKFGYTVNHFEKLIKEMIK
ncbi:MAG: AMP-binding protein [Clostridia bacterium]|nr:AMP-binding protein [Clostridia bacterium]